MAGFGISGSKPMSVRTRFAPSPTGYLHVGGARTALFSWLYARKHGGQFVLRIEDTDLERSTRESVDAILEGMAWLGLDADEGPIFQTDRFDRYKAVIAQLLEKGLAYRCNCPKERLDALREEQMRNKQKPRYDGRCRDADVGADEPHVIRFRTPGEGETVIDDLVRGRVVVPNAELDDLIIQRTDGSPTYNLTVVVDDMDMRISHVIRGDDHLNNTPRQMHIIRALGGEPPRYAHVPMILGDDGARLSKRHGAVSVMQYKSDGYLPEALLNYLVRLGWSHGDQEIFSVKEMTELFEIKDINRAPSAFNTDKLRWLNQHYIKATPKDRLAELLRPFLDERGVDTVGGPDLAEVAEVMKERASTLVEMAEGCGYFYRDWEVLDAKAAKKHLRPAALEPLQRMRERLESLPDWRPEAIHQAIEAVAESLGVGMGKIGMPLRVAVTGGGASPAIDQTVWLIGRDACLRRIDKALKYIEERIANA